jgi:hypothetical protein
MAIEMSKGVEDAGPAPEMQKKISPEKRAQQLVQKVDAQIRKGEDHKNTINEEVGKMMEHADLTDAEKQQFKVAAGDAVKNMMTNMKTEIGEDLGPDAKELEDQIIKQINDIV